MTRPVPELVYFTGTMDAGKSTLALQMNFNHAASGRDGLLLSRQDRDGEGIISTRLGLSAPAIEVRGDTDIVDLVVRLRTGGRRVDYLVCDEAQFYTRAQVDQLAVLVDEFGADVFAYGILTDFRTHLFPGSARLVELADRVEVLQVQKLCWCGARATHNARTVGGVLVREGDQVLVGDVTGSAGSVGYEVLCRRHHRHGQTARTSHAGVLSPDTLDLDVPATGVPAGGGA